MGDSKQVRVDNWGTYFLQRLQQFFNKTDYCDLTLQFDGNVQLKVHRLVISACTEYFTLLEQTCIVSDDILMMPPDLQADVILPIVNFMYTGILEYQITTFEKLYKTAELMNIPVLTKLLDAQRKPVQQISKHRKQVQAAMNSPARKVQVKNEVDLPATLPGRKLPVWKRKTAPSVPAPMVEQKYKPDPLFSDPPKPTRFEWPEDDSLLFNMMDSSFNDISYTSKPLLTQDDSHRNSTFDIIKHLPTMNKKAKVQENNTSAIDMEDMKDYIKEQKIRSDLIDYDDEDVDNELAGYDTSSPKPDLATPASTKRKLDMTASTPLKKVRFSVVEKENKEATINVSQTSNLADVNHTKIISEVLKKYPHLVKKNKNIRLKILAKTPKGTTETKIQTVKTEVKVASSAPKVAIKSIQQKAEPKKEGEGPWVCEKCIANGDESQEFNLYYLYLKHVSEVHNEKIDSKICKFCGHKSLRQNMLMYHQYTKHGIKPPKNFDFPKCNQCPYVAVNESILHKHKMKHELKFDYECSECKIAFNNVTSLQTHMQITAHTGKSGKTNYDCQYCTKKYQNGSALFAHIKQIHHDEAKRDGIISIDETDLYDEDHEDLEEDTEMLVEQPKALSDIKVLSNIKVDDNIIVPQTPEIQRPSSEAEALSNVASGIATSLGLVDIVVLDDNQQYILHSNDQQLVSQQGLNNTNQQFILPELSDAHSFASNPTIGEHGVITQSMLNNSDITSTDELVMVLTDHDYNDGNNEILNNENSNIVVLYSHPVEGQQNQYITTSQGNIMLNSQTGMLEIRNAIPQAPQQPEQIVMNPEEANIESIEMIQREINSHQENKGDAHASVIQKTGVITDMPALEPAELLEGDAAIAVQQAASVPMILDGNDEAMNDLNLQGDGCKSDDIVYDESTLIVSENIESAVQVPVDDMTTSGVVENLPDQYVPAEENMEIDEQCKNQPPMISAPQVLEPAENQEVEMISSVIQETGTVHLQTKLVDEEPQVPTEETAQINESMPELSLSQCIVEEPNTSVINNDPPQESDLTITENVNELPQEILEDINAASTDQEEVKEEMKLAEVETEANEIAEIVDENIINANEETDDIGSLQVDESAMEIDTDEKIEDKQEKPEELLELQNTLQQTQDELMETQQMIEESAQVPTENEQNIVDEIEVPSELKVDLQEEAQQVNTTEEIIEEGVSQPLENVEVENIPQNSEEVVGNEVQMENEPTATTVATSEVVDNATSDDAVNQNEAKIDVESEVSLVINDSEATEVTEKTDSGFQSQETTLQDISTATDENSQSQDETASQVSSADTKELEPSNFKDSIASETTKIAILDDWEDTDSQPSEQGEMQKSESVNKIIDEWADDDEDK